MLSFRNNFKNWDTSKVTAIVLKMEHAVMPSKDVDETANSAGPDQTAPFTLVCTVCSASLVMPISDPRNRFSIHTIHP